MDNQLVLYDRSSNRGEQFPPRNPQRTHFDGYGSRLSPTIRRHRLGISIVFAVCVAAAMLTALLQTPLYRSQVLLEIQARNPEFLNSKSLDPTSNAAPDSFISTQTRLIRTEALAKRVVNSANLRNERLLFQRGTVQASIQRVLHKPAPNFPVSEDAAVAALLNAITVKTEGDSDLLMLTVDTPDGTLSAKLANLLATEFANHEQEARWTEATRIETWLTSKLQDSRAKLQNSEDALQDYANKANLLFTGDHDNIAEDNLRQAQQDLLRAQADKADKQSELGVISTASPDSLPRVLDDGLVKDLAGRLAELKRQEAELSVTLLPTHYKVERVRAEISEIEGQLDKERNTVLKRIHNEYAAASNREEILRANYNKQANVVSEQASRTVRYNVLKREVESDRELYTSLLQHVKDASIVSALRSNSIRIVDAATPTDRQYRPNYSMALGFGFLTGCMGSVLLVLALERNNRAIREPGESVRLHLRELGVIPSYRSDPRVRGAFQQKIPRRIQVASPRSLNDRSKRLAKPSERLVTWTNRRSMMAEAFRSTALSMRSASQVSPVPQVVVVTSPQPQAGKSTTLANLAVALADHKERLLLIDGDLRRPELHSFFGIRPVLGLAQILEDSTPIADCDLSKYIQPTSVPGVDVLSAGSLQDTDPRLLGSSRFSELIDRLKPDYDLVLIDSPPLLHLPDTRSICRVADAAVLLSRAGKTTFDEMATSVRVLEEDGVRLLGTILADWNPTIKNPSYYDSY